MNLPPLPVAIPLLMAAFLAAVGRFIPRRVPDALAVLTSAAVTALCIRLMQESVDNPIVYWFGGWFPRKGVAVGISFVIDPIGAGLGALTGVLVTAAFIFSVRYFDALGAMFHVLMLVFLAALCGFGLTGDLFNLFVFFELMSASAFALCGYKSEEPSPLQGAINFGVTNTIGAFLVLTGIALIYGRTGALNMAQMSRGLGPAHDGLVLVAFAFVVCGFFVKAAVIPFHFWLADAHAVAPTPVCILFSGVMVEAGLYAVARVYGSLFAGPLSPHEAQVRALFIGFGVATALVGGAMCFAQRHLKRLLAFSTISHVGLMVMGFGLGSRGGLAGAAVYALGHGLIKASLFLCVGMLLHRFKTVDEIPLRGRGKKLPTLGVLLTLGGLGLAGLPPFGTFLGESSMEGAAGKLGYSWLTWIFAATAILTGGAVLRAAGRIFLGLGPLEEEIPGVGGETTEKPETIGPHKRLPLSMEVSAAALLLLGLVMAAWPGLRHQADAQSERMRDTAGLAARVLEDATLAPPALESPEPLGASATRGVLVTLGAALLAAVTLMRKSLPEAVRRPVAQLVDSGLHPLRELHSGHVGDYVAWLTVGVVGFGSLCALLLR